MVIFAGIPSEERASTVPLTACGVGPYIQAMTQRGASRGGVAESAPRDLLVDRLEIDGEEFAVFSWDTEAVDEAVDAAVTAAVDETASDPRAALTPSERSVLALVVAGASNAAIARSRGSSVRTVANQVASLLDKLGADSRFDLIRRFGRSGPTSESP